MFFDLIEKIASCIIILVYIISFYYLSISVLGLLAKNKKDKDILFRYFNGARTLAETEEYNAGIYIEQDTKNIIEYNTEEDEIENDGYIREDDIVPEKNIIKLKVIK